MFIIRAKSVVSILPAECNHKATYIQTHDAAHQMKVCGHYHMCRYRTSLKVCFRLSVLHTIRRSCSTVRGCKRYKLIAKHSGMAVVTTLVL